MHWATTVPPAEARVRSTPTIGPALTLFVGVEVTDVDGLTSGSAAGANGSAGPNSPAPTLERASSPTMTAVAAPTAQATTARTTGRSRGVGRSGALRRSTRRSWHAEP